VGEEPSSQPGRWWGCLGRGAPKRPPALVTGLKGAGLKRPLGACWLAAGPCRDRGGGPRGVSSIAVAGRGGVTTEVLPRGAGEAGGAGLGAPSSAWSMSSPEGGSDVGSAIGTGREGHSLSKAVWRPSQLEHRSGEAGQQLGTLLMFPILGQVGFGHL